MIRICCNPMKIRKVKTTGKHRKLTSQSDVCETCNGTRLEYATNSKPYTCSGCNGTGRRGKHRK